MKLWSLLMALLVSVTTGVASAEDLPPVIPSKYIACKSADEFKKAVDYFRGEKALDLNDKQVVKWSITIAKGCDGAVERFKKVFDVLNKSGVDLRKCVEMASEFSLLSTEQTESFAGLFKTFFLENYFDLDFMTAFNLSKKLSENPSRAPFARSDFEKLYKFCTDQDKLGLPFKNCAEYSIGLLKNYDLYPEGLYPFFEKIYLFLSTEAGAVLSVKESLQMAEEVLQYGPLAPENFKNAYQYSISKKGLNASIKQGMRISLEIAKSSLKEKPQ